MFCCKILDTCACQFSGRWYNSVVYWLAEIGNCTNKQEGNCTKQLAIRNYTSKQKGNCTKQAAIGNCTNKQQQGIKHMQ